MLFAKHNMPAFKRCLPAVFPVVVVLVLFQPNQHIFSAHQARDGSIIIDHASPEYQEGGDWQKGGESLEQRGTSGKVARQTKADGAWAQWTPKITQAGIYRVYLWNIPYHSQDSRATIEIAHEGGVKKIVQDMRNGYYGWLPLGDFPLTAGDKNHVKISRGDRTLLVDAVRFRLASSIPPPQPLQPYPAPDGKLPYLDKPGQVGNLILGGKPYLMLGAELENGSALDPADIPYMDTLFDNLCRQHMNTIECPISWKQFEGKEGQFDFSVIDALIERARARNMHLAILWFGIYKNLQSYYSPLWVIHDETRFFRAKNKSRKTIGTVSPFCRAGLEADSRAFGKLLERIKTRDPQHQVVLMVQVENERTCPKSCAERRQRLKCWGSIRRWRKPANPGKNPSAATVSASLPPTASRPREYMTMSPAAQCRVED